MIDGARRRWVAPAIGWVLSAALAGCNHPQTSYAQLLAAEASRHRASSAHPLSKFVVVDQFGYLPAEHKVAVIRSPRAGFDRADTFEPGTTYQVRSADDQSVVFEGALGAWNGGEIQASSGDKGWWFDFSAVDKPGRYFVLDVARDVRSAEFAIDTAVYRPVLKSVMRMFFYQRSGVAKQAPNADACWTDAPSYLGAHQDSAARDVTDRNNPQKVRDLSGGWFDAGDTNKYVTFAAQPVHQLLNAYAEHPAAFTDDFDIPESHNGLPDVIDEVNWEITWLKKMQSSDGSVALKVGEIAYSKASPPSADSSERYYVPSCTSSTIAAAGMFAHASYVDAKFPALAAEAVDLRRRAVSAWKSYQAAPAPQTQCDSGVVHAGNADWSAQVQTAHAVEAAVYLFAITGNRDYSEFVAAHYRDTRPFLDFGWTRYEPDEGEALLFYAALPDADADLAATIRAAKLRDSQGTENVYGFSPSDDLYRAFLPDEQYHWGSNSPRANYGNTNLDAVTYAVEPSRSASFRERALETLHYFHGVNPFGMVYLTNMYAVGATSSANELFHVWFAPGSKWSNAQTSLCGPPPGYLTAGPNRRAAEDGVPANLAPPAGQPPQKSYKDWNGGGADHSWVITEPGIYYQASYVRLLSAFVQ